MTIVTNSFCAGASPAKFPASTNCYGARLEVNREHWHHAIVFAKRRAHFFFGGGKHPLRSVRRQNARMENIRVGHLRGTGESSRESQEPPESLRKRPASQCRRADFVRGSLRGVPRRRRRRSQERSQSARF